jgi:hypothetical protein
MLPQKMFDFLRLIETIFPAFWEQFKKKSVMINGDTMTIISFIYSLPTFWEQF